MIEIPHGRRYIIERCPHCNRRLAEWFEGDRTVTVLHPRAGIMYEFRDVGPYPQDGTPLEGSATCLRVLCRIRSRLSKTTPEESTA